LSKKKYYGKETNEALVEELVAKLSIKLDGYEAILSKQKYFAGNVRHAEASNVESWYTDVRVLRLAGDYPRRSIPPARRRRDIRKTQPWRFREASQRLEVRNL